ncbi:MAG: hypothetical protein IPP19_12245 [Verrucomicrobia bacterium]|nr:hypothetical protein [Verrucomicrobiota bacterium]
MKAGEVIAMKTTKDSSWEQRLRFRLEDFRATVVPILGVPWSLKIRSTEWTFDRESEAQVFAEIDAWMRSHPYLKAWVMDHSTGPEIICYVNSAGKERRVDPYVLELIAVILHSALKNREHRASRKKRVEIVSRGFDDKGRYEEVLVGAGMLSSDELGVGSLLAKFETAGVVFRTPQETK